MLVSRFTQIALVGVIVRIQFSTLGSGSFFAKATGSSTATHLPLSGSRTDS